MSGIKTEIPVTALGVRRSNIDCKLLRCINLVRVIQNCMSITVNIYNSSFT